MNVKDWPAINLSRHLHYTPKSEQDTATFNAAFDANFELSAFSGLFENPEVPTERWGLLLSLGGKYLSKKRLASILQSKRRVDLPS